MFFLKTVWHMTRGQNPNRTPSEHPNPHYNRLNWVVHLPQNGTIGFDPQPHGMKEELAVAEARESELSVELCQLRRSQSRLNNDARNPFACPVRFKACGVERFQAGKERARESWRAPYLMFVFLLAGRF